MRDDGEPTVMADGSSPFEARRNRDVAMVVGDILNGIYRVERFIARGGMGEVFEGVNVETEERVAIKAIRGHLANDPKVVALFRKEARVLTRIAHPAIVHYRVFARDPLLDLHYIVTDFIDGEPISALMDGRRPEVAEIVALARRLASGLEAAHEHGAIHRDMSPDNVLLPRGRIDLAKIIDFGIAKSLDITAETVVGEGFAGKLGYVAPEQFGDFGRSVGPWTDVYSTALVLLAFARGRAPEMGTTLSEAVERRRARADLDDVPPELVPLMEGMLKPDPTERMRSMTEVLAALDEVRITEGRSHEVQSGSSEDENHASAADAPGPRTVGEGAAPPPGTTFDPSPASITPAIAAPKRTGATAGRNPAVGSPDGASKHRRRLGGRTTLLVLAPIALGAGAIYVAVSGGDGGAEPKVRPAHISATPAATPRPLSASERAQLAASLARDLPCTWVDARTSDEDGPVLLSGATGDVAALTKRIASSSERLRSVDRKEVGWINLTQCGVIDALRPFRAREDDQRYASLALSRRDVILGEGGPACPSGGLTELSATVYDPRREISIVSLLPDGRLLQLAKSRAELQSIAEKTGVQAGAGDDGSFHGSICYDAAGSAAVFLIEGVSVPDLGLRTGVPTLPPADFGDRVASLGAAAGARVFAQWSTVSAPADQPPALVTAPPARLGDDDAPAANLSTASLIASTEKPTSRRSAGELTRREAAIDTADFNRRELERIQGLSGRGDDQSASSDACRTFEGRWRSIGDLPRGQCLARAIKGRCKVSFAQHHGRLYRRQGGMIQEQRGSRWRDVDTDPAC